MRKEIYILVLSCFCYIQCFSQKEKETNLQIGIKAIPSTNSIETPKLLPAFGIQAKINIYRWFDFSTGILYSHYSSSSNYSENIILNDENEIIFNDERPVILANYLTVPLLLRFNYKRFYAVFGKPFVLNLGYNRYYIKKFNFNMEIENVKKIAFATTLAIGYQFRLNNKYALDVEANSSAIYNYLEKDNFLPNSIISRLGIGITLYRNFNVNNKKAE